MKYKLVIFDLDGTLVDSLEDIGDAMNRVLVQHSDNEFAVGHNHINGIENFWGLCKVPGNTQPYFRFTHQRM
jgi:phosphoglycolate phosphatase-like HAD superfamily hydrolase